MNSNGILSFQTSFTTFTTSPFPEATNILIAPFWDDFNPATNTGGPNDIFYRISTDLDLLAQAGTFISDQFGISFTPTSLFIATWDQVPRSSGPINEVNIAIFIGSWDQVT